MKGILLTSHGDMAKGMYHSTSLFFGDGIEQLDYLCFQQDDNLIDFEKAMGEKIRSLDTGDGVLIMTDLYAGTPCHKTTRFLTEKIQVICGANFPMLLEALGLRMAGAEIDRDSLMNIGREGIRAWDPALTISGCDDFY